MKRFLLNIVFWGVVSIFAWSEVSLKYSGSGGYSLVERTNLRRYENGKYVGLTSREVRSFISPAEAYDAAKSGEAWFDGNFYVSQDTVRNQKVVSTGIHDSISSIFYIGADGRMTMYEDHGFPSFRSFPAYSAEPLKIGESWTSNAERSVDPMNSGVFTKIPVLVRYTLVGEEVFKGEAVYRIKAIWQTNYNLRNQDFAGDKKLKKALGGHKADIIVLKKNGQPFMILDNVDETFFYDDGMQVNFKGTITMFTEFPAALDRGKLIPALKGIASEKKSERKAKALGGGSVGAITTVNRGEKNDDGKNTAENEEKSRENESSVQASEIKKSKVDGNQGAQRESDLKSEEKNASELKSESTSEEKKQKSSEKSKSKTKSKTREEQILEAKEKIRSGKTGEQALDTFDVGVAVQLESAKNDMIFEETDSGLRLRIQNINFQADSAELILGTEGSRLDDVAKVLKMAPNSKFLIEGHTASVGKPAGEQILSEQRARKIANELVNRGVSADSFIVRGWGGKKPLMPNDTAAGRSMNRRVEITILE